MTNFAQRPLPLPGRPVALDIDDVARQPSGHAVIALCAQKAGKENKVIADDLGIQEAVWSRVKSGANSLSLEDLLALMVACGNDAPLLWLLTKRGYDPHSLRMSESEADRRVREANEAAAKRVAEADERAARAEMKAEISLQFARRAAA